MNDKSRAATGRSKETFNLGKWTEKELGHLIRVWARIQTSSERIEVISEQFLGVGYRESTLVGDMARAEILVVNLERVDCFTFIDYVEAMRLSRSFGGFKKNLVKVRYQCGKVSYLTRNHFFSDWSEFNEKSVADVTGQVGGRAAQRAAKTLNIRKDGTRLLEGIAPRSREITYVPAGCVDDMVLARLRAGDYAGIYTDEAGLDVSHVGIIINDRGRIALRHASSLQANRRVVDCGLRDYLADKPGLVVLRPKELRQNDE